MLRRFLDPLGLNKKQNYSPLYNHIHIYVYVRTDTYVNTYTYICIYVHMYIYIYDAYRCVCIYIYMYECICVFLVLGNLRLLKLVPDISEDAGHPELNFLALALSGKKAPGAGANC